MESDEAVPPRREQRPYVWAFRKFVRNPTQMDKRGMQWTPAVILSELWTLWQERPKERGVEEQFRAKHYQTVERLRGDGKKYSVDDALLYKLLVRFVDKHCAGVLHPVLPTRLRETLQACSHLFAPVQNGDSQGISLVQTAFGHYVALNRSARTKVLHACLALVIGKDRLTVEYGLYVFSLTEVFTFRSTSHDDLKYWERWRFDWPHHTVRFYTKSGVFADVPDGYAYQYECDCEASVDPNLLAFTHERFKELDT